MDVGIEESVPLIFYSVFALTILTVLILANLPRATTNANNKVIEKKKKSILKNGMVSGTDVYRPQKLGKERNRRRSYRVSGLLGKRDTRNRMVFDLDFSTFGAQSQPSTSQTPASGSTSCPSVYFSDTSLQESITDFVTLGTEEVEKQDDMKDTETCENRSEPQRVWPGQQEVRGQPADPDAITCPSTLSASSDDDKHFQVARPALPTALAPSGVRIDSFADVDVCFPPQAELPVHNMVQYAGRHFGLALGVDGKTPGKSKAIKTGRARTNKPVESANRFQMSPARKTSSDRSVQKSRSPSTSNPSPKRWRCTTDNNVKDKKPRKKSKVATDKPGSKRNKQKNQAQTIQEATREVISARLQNISGSVSSSFVTAPAPKKSRSTVTDRTTAPNTSSWDSH